MGRFLARSVLVVQRQRCRDIGLLPLLGRSLYAFLLRYARSAHPAVLPVDRRCRKPLARYVIPSRSCPHPIPHNRPMRYSRIVPIRSCLVVRRRSIKRPTGHNRSPHTISLHGAPESGAEAIDRSLGVTGAPDTTLDECASWRRGIRGAPWADTRSRRSRLDGLPNLLRAGGVIRGSADIWNRTGRQRTIRNSHNSFMNANPSSGQLK